MKMKFLAAAAAALAVAGGSASATTFMTPNTDSALITFDGFSNNQVITGLTSNVLYTLIAHSGANWDFSYVINNTSSQPIDASRVSVIGFDVDPNVQAGANGAVALTGLFNRDGSGSISNGNSVELCFFASTGMGSSCAGGAGTGVAIGQTMNNSGTFRLTFDDANLTSIQLLNYRVRYQSIEGALQNGTDGLPVASAIGRPCDGCGPNQQNFVPEPATWAMMITGFGLAGAVLRRRRTVLA